MDTPRKCGGCTACCYTTAVFSIQKDEFAACRHCTSGGCGIYKTKPQDCSDHSCMWLEGFGARSERPDRSRYVVSAAEVFDMGDVVTIHEMKTGASDSAPLATFVKKWAVRNRLPLWIIREHAGNTLFIPEEADLSGRTLQILRDMDDLTVRKYTVEIPGPASQ